MRKAYKLLSAKYLGHQIPQRLVAEYIAECPECQKIRHSMNDRFQPLLRANHVEHHRQMIGIDGLIITPVDIDGMAYAYVIKVFATKLVASDPGCDLTAEGVQQYLLWSGQTHRTSLVDRH